MSYNRSYNYSSPLGGYSGSHSSSSYSSPSGRYSSTSSYDSTSRRYDSGLSSGGYGSSLGSGLGSSSRYGSGSLSSLSGSSYTPRYSGSSYSPSSSAYSSSKYDSTSRSSGYTPRSDYSSSRYSRPASIYDDYGSGSSRYRSSDLDTTSKHRSTNDDDIPVKANRKTRFADEVETTPKSKRSTDSSSLTTKTSADSSVSEARRRRREEREAEEAKGASPVPTRSADVDVSNVTRKTENLSIDNSSNSAPRPYSPSFQEFGKQAAESARYQEQTGDTPQYRPYTNPNIQSNSFKTLQNVIDTGRDPGSYFQKAPWQSTTVNQVENQPRKYTPSKTWAAVHKEGREAAPPAPGAYRPRKTAPFQPAPASRPQAPPSAPSPYTPPSFYNKPAPKSGSPARNTTQLPHGDGVATKGTSAMNQQAANPDKIPICGKCDTEIRGPFVLALNKSWCPNCFTCDQCKSELVNMGFVELNGKIYCENDYESFFAPKCAKCRQAIIGDTVNALEKTWHPACFVCEECGCAISSGAFHVENGRPYCMKDWQRLFQTKCVGCTYPVEPGDKWIEALDANWHSECFVCGVCQLTLEGQPFYPRDGKPFCKDHAVAA